MCVLFCCFIGDRIEFDLGRENASTDSSSALPLEVVLLFLNLRLISPSSGKIKLALNRFNTVKHLFPVTDNSSPFFFLFFFVGIKCIRE